MEKDIQDLILKNYSESSLIYKSFEKAIYSPINAIIENLSRKISSYLQNQNSKWHIFHTGTLNSLSDRGKIFIKPKFFNDNGSIAIEEFNPLTTAQHFGHRVFYGLFNKNANIQLPFSFSYPLVSSSFLSVSFSSFLYSYYTTFIGSSQHSYSLFYVFSLFFSR